MEKKEEIVRYVEAPASSLSEESGAKDFIHTLAADVYDHCNAYLVLANEPYKENGTNLNLCNPHETVTFDNGDAVNLDFAYRCKRGSKVMRGELVVKFREIGVPEGK